MHRLVAAELINITITRTGAGLTRMRYISCI